MDHTRTQSAVALLLCRRCVPPAGLALSLSHGGRTKTSAGGWGFGPSVSTRRLSIVIRWSCWPQTTLIRWKRLLAARWDSVGSASTSSEAFAEAKTPLSRTARRKSHSSLSEEAASSCHHFTTASSVIALCKQTVGSSGIRPAGCGGGGGRGEGGSAASQPQDACAESGREAGGMRAGARRLGRTELPERQTWSKMSLSSSASMSTPSTTCGKEGDRTDQPLRSAFRALRGSARARRGAGQRSGSGIIPGANVDLPPPTQRASRRPWTGSRRASRQRRPP